LTTVSTPRGRVLVAILNLGLLGGALFGARKLTVARRNATAGATPQAQGQTPTQAPRPTQPQPREPVVR